MTLDGASRVLSDVACIDVGDAVRSALLRTDDVAYADIGGKGTRYGGVRPCVTLVSLPYDTSSMCSAVQSPSMRSTARNTCYLLVPVRI